MLELMISVSRYSRNSYISQEVALTYSNFLTKHFPTANITKLQL